VPGPDNVPTDPASVEQMVDHYHDNAQRLPPPPTPRRWSKWLATTTTTRSDYRPHRPCVGGANG
jgi:hypothetical protein